MPSGSWHGTEVARAGPQDRAMMPARPPLQFTTEGTQGRTKPLLPTDGDTEVSSKDGRDASRVSLWIRAEAGLGPMLDPSRSRSHTIPSREPRSAWA